jgi:L,D-transpeptidase catalytic domain
MLCACSRQAPGQASADDAGNVPVALAAPLSSAPSPFSVAGAKAPLEKSRFPATLAALAWETRVYDQPSTAAKVLGYLRAGATVAADDDETRGDGCKNEWHAVSPVGFVCVEPGNASMDPTTLVARALAHRPDLTQRLPYMYGIVRRQGPIYARLPTRAEADANEPGLKDRMASWLSDGTDDGAAFRPDYWLRGKTDPTPSAATLWQTGETREVPEWLAGGKLPPAVSPLRHLEDLVVGNTKPHNGFALVDTAVVDGRRYGITTDLLVYPVDRMRPIEGSAFHGYRIPDDVAFPIALVRRDGTFAYSMHKGKFAKAREVARRSAIALTGKQRFVEGVLHFQTTDGLWLSDRFVSRVDGVKHMPKWANEGERWLDVSIAKQVLLAYEGTKPVYVTLVSSGEAGLDDPQTTKSTVQGIFRIHTKHLTTTMASDVVGEEFELKDIPYVQYFQDGYALHAAYWHDDFGTPRSHGCINLAPEDARWLFQWTEPQLPTGWHGVRKALSGSVVFIHP